MIVLVLTACPPGLRGQITRWLQEISAGVFVGHLNPRVRDNVWQRVVEGVGTGRAILVFTARNEQGYDFKVHGHDWKPVDLDGIKLMLRPAKPVPLRKRGQTASEHGGRRQEGWSNAARWRKGRY